jgi:hypothetical protein
MSLVDLLTRARRIGERRLVLQWEYRQRHHSKGTWFRLRRALADAAEVWVMTAEDADSLEAEGFSALAVGHELEPPKRIVFVPAERIGAMAKPRRIPVALSAELLAAKSLALVRHDPSR